MTTRRLITCIALIAAITVPAIGWAHDGHSEKVMGTVSSVDGNHVMVKTTAGKTVMVVLDAKTRITRGKTVMKAADVKVGDRVVAAGPLEKDMLMATSLQLEAAPTTSASAKAEPEQAHAH